MWLSLSRTGDRLLPKHRSWTSTNHWLIPWGAKGMTWLQALIVAVLGIWTPATRLLCMPTKYPSTLSSWFGASWYPTPSNDPETSTLNALWAITDTRTAVQDHQLEARLKWWTEALSHLPWTDKYFFALDYTPPGYCMPHAKTCIWMCFANSQLYTDKVLQCMGWS